MSACAPIVEQRLGRAGHDVLAVHLALEEQVEQRPDPLLRHGSPVAARKAPAKPGASSAKVRSCGLVDPVGEMGDEVQDHLVAIADQQRPAHRPRHASSRGAFDQLRRGDVESARAGDQIGLVALEEAKPGGEQVADRRAARAAAPGSARSAPATASARASSLSVQPSARNASASVVICLFAAHRLRRRAWDRKSWLSRTTSSI